MWWLRNRGSEGYTQASLVWRRGKGTRASVIFITVYITIIVEIKIWSRNVNMFDFITANGESAFYYFYDWLICAKCAERSVNAVIGLRAKCSVNMVIGPSVSSLKHGSDTSVKKGFMALQTSTKGGKAGSVTNRSADHSSEPELLNRHHRGPLPGWCLTSHIKQYHRKSAMSAATAVDSSNHSRSANCAHTISLCTSCLLTIPLSGWRNRYRHTVDGKKSRGLNSRQLCFLSIPGKSFSPLEFLSGLVWDFVILGVEVMDSHTLG